MVSLVFSYVYPSHAARSSADHSPVQINGWAADKYGPKIVMMVSTIALAGFIFLSVFAQNLGTLVAAQVLCGLVSLRVLVTRSRMVC